MFIEFPDFWGRMEIVNVNHIVDIEYEIEYDKQPSHRVILSGTKENISIKISKEVYEYLRANLATIPYDSSIPVKNVNKSNV